MLHLFTIYLKDIEMSIFVGTLPAMLTPYNNDRSINKEEFINLARFGIKNGLNGIFCNGSAGDGLALGFKEKIELMRLSVEAARDEVPVISGIGSSTYSETLEMAKEAKKAGVDALILQPPFYYPINESNMIEYFSYISSSVALPVYAYNIPLFAPAMSLKVIEAVSKMKNIVGMKDSSGSSVDFAHICDICDFDIFVGREEYYLGALMQGAKGSMTSCGGVFPEIMSGIFKAFNESNFQEAQKLQKSILKAIRFASTLPFPLGYALLLKARGLFSEVHTIHPISKESRDLLNAKFSEAKEVINKINSEVGLSNI